jgi:uncharacterized protein YmfQ (DUF2313 family)
MGKKLFTDKTQEQATDSLVSFVPGGRPFLAARLTGTKLRALLTGLASEILRADGIINEITSEHEITTTTSLIEEWERALGIPDSCFSNTGTIQERRLQVLAKLAKMSLQTDQDFIDLAALFGVVVSVVAGADRGLFPFELTFPVYLFDTPQTARHTLVVVVETTNAPNVFPLEFPIIFGSNLEGLIECLFRKLKPANVEIVFEYVLPDEGALITESGLFYLATESDDILLLES